MARQGRSFNEHLAEYKANASEAELAAYEDARAEFSVINEFIERRKAAGLTQLDLAAATGIGQPEISRIEGGAGNPTMTTLNRIARALHVRVSLVEDRRVSR